MGYGEAIKRAEKIEKQLGKFLRGRGCADHTTTIDGLLYFDVKEVIEHFQGMHDQHLKLLKLISLCNTIGSQERFSGYWQKLKTD